MGLIEEVYSNIELRKHNIEIGEINGIPFPIPEMVPYIPAIEKSNFVLIAGPSKAGKTQLCNYAIIYNSIMYAYNNPDKLSVHFILFPLEEGKEMTLCRFMSYILYTQYDIRISPTDLMSSNPNKPLENNILEILKSERFLKLLNFFESCIQFEEASTSVGIDIIVNNYIDSHGEKIYGDESFIDSDGKEKRKIIGYKPHNPKEYVFVVLDNVNLVTPTKEEKTILTAGDNIAKNFVKYFRTYKYICVMLQQCLDSEITSMDASKNDNILVSKASLKDVKSTGNSATLFLGIVNPGAIQNLKYYQDYDVRRFKRKYLRFCNIVFQRFGEGEVVAPLYFDGAVNYYSKFPKPDDKEGLARIDRMIEHNNTGTTRKFALSMLFKKLFNKNK